MASRLLMVFRPMVRAAAARYSVVAARPTAPKNPSLTLTRAFSASGDVTVDVPPMGESITEGTVVTFLKQVGEAVEMDEPVLQIETDKVTVDVPSPQAGIITGFLAEEDDEVEVGQALFTVAAGDASPAAPVAESATAKPAAPDAAAPAAAPGGDPIVVLLPEISETINEGTVADFLKGPGDYVEVDEVIAQVETDKVTVDVPAPMSGVIGELFATADDEIMVGNPLFSIVPGGQAPAKTAPAAAAASTPAAPTPAAPAAPTPAPPATPAAPAEKAAPAPPAPSVAGARGERRVELSRMRKKIANVLKDAQNTAALLTTFNEVDMSGLMGMRTEYKEAFEAKHGCRLGLMSPFFAACAAGLMEQPAVNSQIHGSEQVFFDYADIGFAAATPKGLVVPVLRSVESSSLADIERGIASVSYTHLTLPTKRIV
eukprot:TRINITY_DN19876_c0_g2_i4.p1 TRINITY_DN19876_c0_g2~~TRINITY_DN19876_c0_g2_i4.p1  ORF type:complete len:430 (+),score=132.30 TRINITY_DN19876_c0_g2_i4:171-1460(+)